VIEQRRKKRRDPIRNPSPAIVPTELPVFEELERLGLVVPVSAKDLGKRRSRRPTRR
jgi:hypothetical protein